MVDFLPFWLYWTGSVLAVAGAGFILHLLFTALRRRSLHKWDRLELWGFGLLITARAVLSFFGVMGHGEPISLNAGLATMTSGMVMIGFARHMWRTKPRNPGTLDDEESEDVRVAIREACYDLSLSGWIVSGEIYIYRANTAFLETFGYSPTELAELPLETIIHPLDRELVKNNLLRGYRGRFNIRAVKKSGEEIIVEARGSQVIAGGKKFMVLSVHDITEQQRLIQKLTQDLQFALNQVVIRERQHEIIKAVKDNGGNE